ncbi:MAG: DUF4304 domain-containing protein [Phycisphaera sp.]|nr:DUF4304 domain-containing protein [Phycisphaera sp.]
MSASRDMMLSKIKRTVVPVLHDLGFKGLMPHYHRVRGRHVDLAYIQFASGGGSFVVELSYADSARDNVDIPKFKAYVPDKLRVSHMTVSRRLGAGDDSDDFWFAFEKCERAGMAGTPSDLASSVARLLETDAVSWWDSQRTDD